MKTSKYFKDEEFRRCQPPCSINDMEQDFLDRLDALRERTGVPLQLTSAYRPVEWERTRGRTGSGDHPNRRGVDFAAADPSAKFRIVKSALELGFTRIGIANGFVHIGDTATLSQNVLWLY